MSFLDPHKRVCFWDAPSAAGYRQQERQRRHAAAGQQDDVGCGARGVARGGGNGDAHVCRGERWRVIDAVTNHDHAAACGMNTEMVE